MTIKLAIMRPGKAASGRRYFRGTDRNGTHYWLLEEKGSEGHRWILQVDPGGSLIAPEDVMRVVTPSLSQDDVKLLEEQEQG